MSSNTERNEIANIFVAGANEVLMLVVDAVHDAFAASMILDKAIVHSHLGADSLCLPNVKFSTADAVLFIFRPWDIF